METTLIYFSISDLKVTTARHILTEVGIESFIIHKDDSVFSGIFGGKIELYVRKEEQEAADKVLRENDMFD
jgi:hypothetical protein